jgi:uncharacterized protein (DUF2141 family)
MLDYPTPVDFLSTKLRIFAISSNWLGSAMTITRKRYLGPAAVCALAIAPCAAAQQGAKVTVTVNKVATDAGAILGSLCADPAVFATSPCAGPTASTPAKTGSVELVFADVKPGTYGLALFHEEDGDGRINPFSDAMAFGNGATELPPVFDNASLKVTGDLKTETTLFKMVQ